MLFACPKCKKKLNILDTGVARCDAGHSFDLAKAGYYNLLLGNSGGIHGDNREMVEARRAFLSRGYYEPLANAIAELILKHAETGCRLVDAGCGEGYYTDFVERALNLRDGESHVSGFDISRDAVKAAHRRNADISLAVASSYDMPLSDGSVDLLLNVFSPLALDETRRVLKKGGIFIMVFPGQMHLFSLKCAIYDTPYKNKPEPTELADFQLVDSTHLEYNMDISDSSDLHSLFMMTPYAYRTPKEARERIMSIDRLSCEADFHVLIYKKI
jgi:23S rRNA (guanine745-N1)-methyltransferase